MSTHTESGLGERRSQLLAAIREQGGEWTTKRVQRLYRSGVADAPLNRTVRRDLRALSECGHLVMRDEPGRRYFLLNATQDGAL